MATDNLLATLENTLRQTRATRSRLASRLTEVEREAESLRAEISEMDMLAAQTEATMYRFMSAVLGGGGRQSANRTETNISPEGRLEPVIDYYSTASQPKPQVPGTVETVAGTYTSRERGSHTGQQQPGVTATPSPSHLKAKESTYSNLTIPQATAALLRDAGVPLHVNDIYEHLLAGGFVFSGHNPTISIAVSLNRNPRFRKVSPGTFDLVLRDVAA